MKHPFIYALIAALLCLTACRHNAEDEPVPAPEPELQTQTLLVYMVAANSLADSANDDLAEMQKAMTGVDLSQHNLLIFISDKFATQTLYRMEQSETDPALYEMKAIKEYDTSISSVCKERMAEVMEDMQQLAPAKNYGLILWSHATAWTPSFKALGNNPVTPSPTSFGDEFGHKMNIDQLALALPDNLFEFIWMDCCHMSNIETIWQLRNKCRYYAAYPTEILAEGMPYQLTLPLLMHEEGPKLAEAAETLFQYFNDPMTSFRAFTVAVIDMDKMQEVADAARQIYAQFDYPDPSGVQLYSRGSLGPYYDLVHYATRVAPDGDVSGLQQALDNATIYKAATEKFLNLVIDPAHFSGVSTHAPTGADTNAEKYYITLDWYRDIFPSSTI